MLKLRSHPSELGISTRCNKHLSDRQVKLTGVPLSEFLIPKSYPTGELILSLWEEYEGFATKFQDDVASNGDPTHLEPEEVEEASVDEELPF